MQMKKKDYLESLWVGEAPKENRKRKENKRREKAQERILRDTNI